VDTWRLGAEPPEKGVHMGKRNAATAYANKWKGKDDDVHNPKYLSWGSNDCTDFISQCLRAG